MDFKKDTDFKKGLLVGGVSAVVLLLGVLLRWFDVFGNYGFFGWGAFWLIGSAVGFLLLFVGKDKEVVSDFESGRERLRFGEDECERSFNDKRMDPKLCCDRVGDTFCKGTVTAGDKGCEQHIFVHVFNGLFGGELFLYARNRKNGADMPVVDDVDKVKDDGVSVG